MINAYVGPPVQRYVRSMLDQLAAGGVDAICDELERRRDEYGLHYFTVGDDQFEAFAPVVERLAGK